MLVILLIFYLHFSFLKTLLDVLYACCYSLIHYYVNIILEFLLKIIGKLCQYIETFYINNNCWNKPAFFYFTSMSLTIKFRWIVIDNVFEIKTSTQLSKRLRTYSSSFILKNIFCRFKNKTCARRNLFSNILSDQKGKVHSQQLKQDHIFQNDTTPNGATFRSSPPQEFL